MDQARRTCKTTKYQRPKRLEPVLEHCVLPVYETCRKAEPVSSGGKKGKSLSLFYKLRDGYVKLMNDMASGADMAGVSSFYGCSTTYVTDYPGAVSQMRTVKEDEEMLQALQSHLAGHHNERRGQSTAC